MINTWQADSTVSRFTIGQKGVTRGITHKVSDGKYMATMVSCMGDHRSEVEAYCASK